MGKINATEKCKICGLWIWDDPHVCLPLFLVYHEDHMGDKPRKIYASTFYEAGVKYAEMYDQDDHPLLEYGCDDVIKIVDPKGETKYFTMSAEANVDYDVNEVDAPGTKTEEHDTTTTN